ncbi:MAG: TolB family protein [Gaiellaceae bacterium]
MEARVPQVSSTVHVVMAAMVTALAGATSPAAGPAAGGPPVAAGLIAYARVAPPGTVWPHGVNPGSLAVYTIRPDGTGNRAVVSGQAPAWSPDGESIAVDWDHIYAFDPDRRIEADGRNGRELTARLCAESSWSPDGRRIACFGPDDGMTYNDAASLWLVDVRTKRARRLLTVYSQWGEYPDAASWSPDGTRLAFSTHGRLRVLDLRTGRVRTLGLGKSPDWSPTGDRIVYSTGRSLVVSNTDGRARRTIVRGKGIVQEPCWSPDAKWIVYAAFSPGDGVSIWGVPRGLRLVAATGGALRVLTPAGSDPDWQPR